MSNIERLRRSLPAIDLLNSPAADSYFEVREHESFYKALKTAHTRRNHHAKLIDVCEEFLAQTTDEVNQLLLDQIIALASHKRATAIPGTTVAAELQRQQSRGYALLDISPPLTFESLKSKYRVAARKYHPDVGGSHDDMVAIIETRALGHFLLVEEQRQQSSPEGAEVRFGEDNPVDCNDYRCVIRHMLFSVHLDDWALDKASVQLEALMSDASSGTPFMRRPFRLMRLTQDATKLMSRLTLTHMDREIAVAERAVRKIEAEELRSNETSSEVSLGISWPPRSPKVVLNHIRQAENALRLGIIDHRRYDRLVGKFADAALAEERRQADQDAMLHEYVRILGFLRLPTDLMVHATESAQRLVPEPGYYVTRSEDLTKEQQSEYYSAFSGRVSPELVRKYKFVRLQSLLETAILYDSDLSFEAIEREALLLGQLSGDRDDYYSAAVADAVQFLERLPQENRAERLALLRHLNGDKRTIVGPFAFTGEGAVCSVSLLRQYFDFLRLPIKALRQLAKDSKRPAQQRTMHLAEF